MAENPRQEIELPFDGKTFRVRPNFETITSVEVALGEPARVVGRKCLSAGMSAVERARMNAGPEVGVSEFAIALYWILRSQKDAPATILDVGNVLVEDGYGNLLLPVGQFLVRAQRGNKEHEKEAAEEALKAKEAGQAGDKNPTES